jgi:hypothetical protein
LKRSDLEHIIRAAATISGDGEIVIVGSQSVLGQFPDAPAELLVSNEADVYPKHHPERWNLIDGSIGELSPFHDTFGYYAQGVEPGTATLPNGWETRLVPIRNENTWGATGLCIDFHDLLVSKYVAGRDKDRRFIGAAFRYGMVIVSILRERLAATEIDSALRQRIEQQVAVDMKALDST